MEDIKQEINQALSTSKNPWSNMVQYDHPLIGKIKDITNFLPQDARMPQRVWHVLNDKLENCICPRCNKNELKWHLSIKGYSKTCGCKIVKPPKKTKEELVEQRRKYNLEKYGHINVLQSKMVKDIKMKKYGTTAITTTDVFKTKRKKTMIEKYGVEYSGQSKELEDKRKQTCIEKYGSSSFSNYHITEDALSKLNDEEWLYEQHVVNKRALIDIAAELNVWYATVANYVKRCSFSPVRHPTSSAEWHIKQLMEDNNISVISNDRKILNGKELDMYIPGHNLAIEYCGLYWHSEQIGRCDQNYHFNKWKQCYDKNIQLITIFEDEYTHNRQQVEHNLLSVIRSNHQDNNVIKLVNTTQASTFFSNFINPIIGKVHVGSYNGDRLIACGTFDEKVLCNYESESQSDEVHKQIVDYYMNVTNNIQILTSLDLRWKNCAQYERMGWELTTLDIPKKYSADTRKKTRQLTNGDCANAIWDCGIANYRLTI